MFLIVSEDEGVTREIQNGKSMQCKCNAFMLYGWWCAHYSKSSEPQRFFSSRHIKMRISH